MRGSTRCLMDGLLSILCILHTGRRMLRLRLSWRMQRSLRLEVTLMRIAILSRYVATEMPVHMPDDSSVPYMFGWCHEANLLMLHEKTPCRPLRHVSVITCYFCRCPWLLACSGPVAAIC